mgnify:CR=1 FL=1
MLKKIFVCIGVILLIGFVSVFARGFNYQKEKSSLDNKNVKDTTSSKKQKLIDEKVINPILEQKNKEDKSENNSTNQKNKENKSENNSTNQKNNSNKQQTVKTETHSTSQKPAPTQNIPQQNTTTPNPPKPTPEVPSKPKTEWEILGITEYEYYNTPLLSYEKVHYKNMADCQREAKSINQKYGFVTSYGDTTGKYVNTIGCWVIVSMNGKDYYLDEFRALGY